VKGKPGQIAGPEEKGGKGDIIKVKTNLPNKDERSAFRSERKRRGEKRTNR